MGGRATRVFGAVLALLLPALLGCEDREPPTRGVGEGATSAPPSAGTGSAQQGGPAGEPGGPPPAPSWGSHGRGARGRTLASPEPAEEGAPPATDDDRGGPASGQAGPRPEPESQAGAEEREAPARAQPDAMTLCMWFAYGRKELLCVPQPLAEAQKRCDERVRAQLGPDARCSCSTDPDYVGDTCEGL